MPKNKRCVGRRIAVLKILLTLFSCLAIAVLALMMISSSLLRNDGGHIETEGNSVFGGFAPNKLELSLVRERLDTITLNDDGFLTPKKNEEIVDFSRSDAKKQNVFGLTDGMVVGPGTEFTAYMNLSNKTGGSFAYWLGVPLSGDVNDFARQMRFTVEIKDGESYKQVYNGFLSDGSTAGSSGEPLAIVGGDEGSSFRVKIRFEIQDDNNLTKNLSLAFDLVVYAIAV